MRYIGLKYCLIACLLPFMGLAQARHFDVLIRHGKIVDGSGGNAYMADIGINGNKIVALGNLSDATCNKLIDAEGYVVAPGFIDIHTHIEGDEKARPTAENFIYDGVTSVITGNCGTSNINIKAYLAQLQQIRLSVNVGTLIGHNDVRRAILGEADEAPNKMQLQQMEELVDKAMRDGAFGLSTGLIYTPGVYAKTDEVLALAKVAAKYHGVYTSHIRNETDKVFDAIAEAIDIGRQANMPVEISHFKVGKPNWGKSDTMLLMVDNARKEGIDVTIDQYPYTASSATLDVLIPEWLLAGGRAQLRARLRNALTYKKAVTEMLADMQRRGRSSFNYAVVAHCDFAPAFDGKTISEVNLLKGRQPNIPDEIETILDITKAGGADMVFHSLDERDVERIMRYPYTSVISDSGIREFGAGMPHPRGYGSNARVLGYYVRQKNILTLQDAIRRMTSLPAHRFGLTGRGLLRVGMFADVVVFDPDSVIDMATYTHPHAYAKGFKYVIVNGKITVDNFKHNGTRNGVILRRE